MIRFFRYFWISLPLSLAAAAAAMRVGFGRFYLPELWWGLGLLCFNAFFALFVLRKAVGADTVKFFFYSLIVNSLRIFVLIIAMIIVYVQDHTRFEPFMTAVLIGYFCFLFGEILGLHAVSEKGVE